MSVSRPSDANYHYTDPNTTTDYTIDRKTSIGNTILARETHRLMAIFSELSSRWSEIYWHALEKDNGSTCLATLKAASIAMASNGSSTTAATIQAKCARSYDWIN